MAQNKPRISNSSKDLLLIGGLTALVLILSYFFNTFLFLVELFRKHPRALTFIDEIIVGLMTIALGFAVFSLRRWRELKKEIRVRMEAERKLTVLATHDELTGCLNFRSTMEALENEISRSRRYQSKFSMIMIDIDDFKKINDVYGHLAGNDAITAVANVVKSSVRNIDVVGRYGGDEFIILLPETDPQHAQVVTDRIRSGLEKVTVASTHLENDRELTIKFSAGIASFPNNAKDSKELIWFVDSALRQAKQEGKDRVIVA